MSVQSTQRRLCLKALASAILSLATYMSLFIRRKGKERITEKGGKPLYCYALCKVCFV